jgi:hypothetical protein
MFAHCQGRSGVWEAASIASLAARLARLPRPSPMEEQDGRAEAAGRHLCRGSSSTRGPPFTATLI